MRIMKVVVPSLVITLGLVLAGTAAFAKPEYSKKEKKGCTTCHVAMGKKDLNDTGKCYAKNNHSLDECTVAKK